MTKRKPRITVDKLAAELAEAKWKYPPSWRFMSNLGKSGWRRVARRAIRLLSK